MERASSPVIDLVARGFEVFATRDFDALMGMLTDDVEVRSLVTEAEQETYHGHDGVRAWIARLFEIFPDWNPVWGGMTMLRPDAVLITFDVTGTAVASGVPVSGRYWMAATVRDGLVNWYGFFRTEEDARAAVEERG